MNQKRLRILIVFLCFYLLASLLYLPKARGKELIPPSIPEMIALDRQIPDIDEEQLKADFLNLLYRFDSLEENIVDERLFQYSGTKPIWLGKEEAREDVEWLFKILRYGYAAYGYFGGDEVFLPVKAAISDEIERQGDRILTAAFTASIRENLSFVRDGHFFIDGMPMVRHAYTEGEFPHYYVNDDCFFYQDSRGYYTDIDDEKYYLVGVEGGSGEDSLKLCLDCEGRLAFCLGQLMPYVSMREHMDIRLEGPAGIINEEIVLTANIFRAPGVAQSLPLYNFKEFDGIALVECKGFKAPVGKITEDMVRQLYNFSEDAKELKSKDVIILDLRGNRGGYPIPGQRWLENLTGQRVYTNYISCVLRTPLLKALNQRVSERNFEENARDLYETLFGQSPFGIDFYESIDSLVGWENLAYDAPRRVKNNRIVFVVIDEFVASGGEHFVSLLRQVDNVVFVGGNTQGATLTNSGSYFLPNSGLPVGFGGYLFLDHELKNKDYIGFAPDIYVPSREAVDRLKKFIARYDPESLKYKITQ